MRPLVQKLLSSENSSFVARTYKHEDFRNVPWHQHSEIELILILEGNGQVLIGNFIGNYQIGDIYLIGSNLSHVFKYPENNTNPKALVIQFDEWFLGDLFNNQAFKPIQELFKKSQYGIKINHSSNTDLAKKIKQIERLQGIKKILKLIESLADISENKHYTTLSTEFISYRSIKYKKKIEKIIEYTHETYLKSIKLEDVAEKTGMSVNAFCTYFKKTTRKTFFHYLNELRIGHACNLLITTEMTISEIAFNSGYNTLDNFNKQFFKIKKIRPKIFRNKFNRIRDKK